MTEKELVLRAQTGDVDAFCTLYDRYKRKLFNYAYYKLGNTQDAEDAVQDCMLSAYARLAQLKKPEAFAAWLYAILYHGCMAGVKAQIARREQADIDAYANSLSAAQSANLESQELRQALGILSEENQNIVLLSAVVGLSSREVAKITGLTAGTVRQRLRRSLSKMKSYLS